MFSRFFAMEFAYPLSHFLHRIVLSLFADWRVQGRHNVPPTGPLIVVANHQSYMDPPLLAASLPRRLYFLATKDIFRDPIISAFLRNYRAFRLEGRGNDLRAFHWAFGLLKRGEAIALFPEGRRNPGCMGRAVSPGVATLALRARAPILPVGIVGTERLKPLWRVVLPTGALTVTIGQPFMLPSIDGKIGRDRLNSFTDMIMERVANLLPEQYRGDYHTTGGTRYEGGPRYPNVVGDDQGLREGASPRS
ncbi:MAG: lysophospholipid acyltransferase family protein [Dehalococcoidia bacterium]